MVLKCFKHGILLLRMVVRSCSVSGASKTQFAMDIWHKMERQSCIVRAGVALQKPLESCRFTERDIPQTYLVKLSVLSFKAGWLHPRHRLFQHPVGGL